VVAARHREKAQLALGVVPGSADHHTMAAMLVATGFALAGLLATRVVPGGLPHRVRPRPEHLFRHLAGGVP
jgi:hypothetical protein